MHRDVKGGNFLFLDKSADSPLKATDFGLAVRHSPADPKLSAKAGTPVRTRIVRRVFFSHADV